MTYGTIKVDTVTFTDGGVDKSVSISGLVQNPTFSGNITVTGTVSGNTIQGQTVSGVTVTGTTALFSTGTFISLTGTTSQGTTATYTSGSFTSLTGVTTSGTTANFVSGVFSTQISGATVTGNAGAFTTLTGGVTTITSGVFAAGSAANPSISFTADPDTGLYSPGANQLALSTNGTGRLFVDASGNVGFGVSSPERLIHLPDGGILLFGTTAATGTQIAHSASSNLTINNKEAGAQIFYTSDTERLRITSGGLVGIGTSSPGATLHVEGLGNTVNQRIFTSDNVSGATASLTFGTTPGSRSKAAIRMINSNTGNAAGDLSLLTDSGSSGLVSRLYISAAGNVGIGTTSPLTRQQTNINSAAEWTSGEQLVGTTNASTTAFYLLNEDSSITATETSLVLGAGGSAGAQHSIAVKRSGSNTGDLIFRRRNGSGGSLESLRITSAGLVGIGTSSPGSVLDLGVGTTGRALSWHNTSTASYGHIWNAYGSGAVVLAHALKGSTSVSDGFESSISTSRARSALELKNGTINLYTDPASTVAYGTSFTPTPRLSIDSSGRVGIGTTNASSLFSSSTNVRLSNTSGKVSYEAVVLDGTNNNRVGLFVDSGTGDLGLDTGSTTGAYNGLSFYIDGSKKATIDRLGRLLVGTSSTSIASTAILQGRSDNATEGAVLRLARGLNNPADGSSLSALSFTDSGHTNAALIAAVRDGGTWTSGVSQPTRLVFSVTADGASSPTEALRISNNRAITVSDGGNVVLGTTTGTKIGTATTQKLGFYNATPVVQPAAVADATDAATVITQLNDLLAKLRTLGIIAT